MIALRIGPDLRMAVVGSPTYFRKHGKPETPQELTDHNCINMRLPTYGGLYVWEFEKDGRQFNVRVDGQLVFNTLRQRLDSAVQGLGLAYLPEEAALPFLGSGELVRVLEAWCPPFSIADRSENAQSERTPRVTSGRCRGGEAARSNGSEPSRGVASDRLKKELSWLHVSLVEGPSPLKKATHTPLLRGIYLKADGYISGYRSYLNRPLISVMNFISPRESRPDFIALCRSWRDENRAFADDLVTRRLVHTELIAGEWRDVSMADADRHARIAAELESLLAEFARS